MGFYRQTIERFAEIGDHRLSDCEDTCAGVELTPEECEFALQGNPPPCRCRKEVTVRQRRWIVTVEKGSVRVTRAAFDQFDPGI